MKSLGVAGALTVAALSAGIAGASGPAGANPSAAPGQSANLGAVAQNAIQRAQAAGTARPLTLDDFDDRKASLTSPDGLKAAASAAVTRVSLPPGHDLTVNWEAGARAGGDNEYGVNVVTQFNAACQWYRYFVDQRGAKEILPALHAIADWPAIRGIPGASDHFASAAESAARNGVEAASVELKLNCPSA